MDYFTNTLPRGYVAATLNGQTNAVIKKIRTKHLLDNYEASHSFRTDDTSRVLTELRNYVKELGFIIESSNDLYFNAILFGCSPGAPQPFLYDPQPSADGKPVPVCSFEVSGSADVKIEMLGDPDFINRHLPDIKAKYPLDGKIIKVGRYEARYNSISTFKHCLKVKPSNQPKDVFYPQIVNETLEDYWEAYLESDASILLLIGPPGTGKTTWLRGLAAKPEIKVLICDEPAAIESGQIFEYYQDSDFQLLVVEEADRYLMPREDGNSMMGSLLNAADGIIQHERKKIVISTNLSSVNKVDQALLRVGRCFDVLKFDYLTPQQAHDIEVSEGLEHQDFGQDTKITLSKVLNPESRLTTNRYGKPLGF